MRSFMVEMNFEVVGWTSELIVHTQQQDSHSVNG